MESAVWDGLFCLLPWLVLLLLSLGLRWPGLCCRVRSAVRAAGCRLWVAVCLILELPTYKKTMIQTEEVRPLDIFSGSGQVSDGPRVVCKPTALAKYLLRSCGSLTRMRMASWPRGDPHLQMLSGMLCEGRRGGLRFSREHLLLKDGGVAALDWAVGTVSAEMFWRKRCKWRKENQLDGKTLGCITTTPPIVLAIPQYRGGMSPHLKALCQQATQHGFYAVVVHARGTAGCPLTTARLTEFGDPADLEQVLVYIHRRHPSSMLVAVSEGSGSGVLLSYLGESGSSSYLTAAAAISPVLLGQLWFEADMPPIYRCGVLFPQKLQLSRYKSSFVGVLDVDQALRSSTIRDFEESLFCPPAPAPPQNPRPPAQGLSPSAAWALGERAYPAEDWDSYWQRNEPLRDADDVAVPVLCIRSHDDPLLPPAASLPISLFQNNPYFLLALTERGGHCGFTLERQERLDGAQTGTEEVENDNWSHAAVLEYFRLVADFLRSEERDGLSWNDLPGETSQRSKMANTAAPRRRRATTMRRSRPQTEELSGADSEDGRFTWKRSYTR